MDTYSGAYNRNIPSPLSSLPGGQAVCVACVKGWLVNRSGLVMDQQPGEIGKWFSCFVCM